MKRKTIPYKACPCCGKLARVVAMERSHRAFTEGVRFNAVAVQDGEKFDMAYRDLPDFGDFILVTASEDFSEFLERNGMALEPYIDGLSRIVRPLPSI